MCLYKCDELLLMQLGNKHFLLTLVIYITKAEHLSFHCIAESNTFA